MKENKYVFFDLDGTLLNQNHQINPQTITAIEQVKKNNNYFSIATGRSLPLAIDYINQIKANNYAIICNGSLIYNPKNKQIIEVSKPLNSELKNYFFDIVEKYQSSFLIYTSDKNYFFSFNEQSKKPFLPFLENSIDMSNLEFSEVKKKLNQMPVYAFSQHSNIIDENEFMSFFKDAKENKKWCNMSSALKGFVDIYGYGISKLAAFKKICDLLNLNLDDVYYFGDSMNDYEMISYVKNSIAMGNAVDALKQKAKYLIGTNNSDAIAIFLIKEFI